MKVIERIRDLLFGLSFWADTILHKGGSRARGRSTSEVVLPKNYEKTPEALEKQSWRNWLSA